jgi:hypothetical protein
MFTVLVGGLAGKSLLIGTFDPSQAAYSVLAGGMYSALVNAQITPSLIGPSLAHKQCHKIEATEK